jgi:hypothetical protein
MQPLPVQGDAVALAEPGRVYTIYLPHGGSAGLDLSGFPGPFTASWFNPRDGTPGKPFKVEGGGKTAFDAPDKFDWTLLLQRGEPVK